MMPGIEFAPLTDALVEAVAQLEKQCFTLPWSKEAFRDEVKNPAAHYLVLLQDGRVTGYGGFWKILDEGHITNIAIAPQARGKGLGRLLVEALQGEARREEIHAMTLEVRATNAVAISLYEKTGFRFCGVRPHYYPDGEDARIYWLEEL